MPLVPKEIFIAYELRHIEEARASIERGAAVVCLDFMVERELKKKYIPYISIQEVLNVERAEEEYWYALSHTIARGWYRLPAMAFFKYRDIALAETPEPIFEKYLAALFYYVRRYLALKKAYPNAFFHIPASGAEDMSSVGCLVALEWLAATDAARMAGLRCDTTAASTTLRYVLPSVEREPFLVQMYNFLINLTPHRSFKIYASEYWSHIASVIEQMNNVELVLMESSELKHISWRQLLKHRIRIRHPREVIQDAERHAALQKSGKFIEQWKAVKGEVAAYLASIQGKLDWSPVLEACEYLITYAPRVIADIDALCRIMEEEKPNVVLQLASIGLQHSHFLLMARVAAQFKVPSLELQHATVTIDPRSVYCAIETDYLATYGTDINTWHKCIGHASDRLIAVGSPRFDQYVNERAQGIEKGKKLFTRLGLDPARPVLLAAVPASGAYTNALDPYQLAEFFEVIRAVQSAIPTLQILFKFRNARHITATYGCFPEPLSTDWVLAGDEDLFALLCASDAVVCSNSTIIYQTVLAQKPLVLYPWKIFDTYHAQLYTPLIPLVRTTEEVIDTISHIFADVSYREELMARQREFLKGYSFDGHSSERVATLLRDLPRKRRGGNLE